MTPPPAEELLPRLFRGPALRTQSDKRLVSLVRDGYEAAFEEVVRRYGRPLTRYAAAIVGPRGEDVTQEAFSKALLALRRDGAEIELRPWLFRIVRNTALNDLRDSPPSPEALAETIAGGSNPAEELERREELADLIRRLQSLPEPQRAAIVMRELEGLSHEEIAAALGLSGGAARQTIYRARRALRDGFGMLMPLPLLKALLAWTAAAPVDAAAGAAGLGGGAGAGVALKAATATVLVAGVVGAGVAVHDNRQGESRSDAKAQRVADDDPRPATASTPAGNADHGPGGGAADAGGSGHSGEPQAGDDRGERHGGDDDRGGTGRDGGEGRDGSNPEPSGGHDDRSGPSSHREPDDDSHRSGSSEGDSSGPGDHGSGEDGGLDDHSGSGDDSPSSGGDDSASSEGSGSNSGPDSGGSEDGEASGSEDSGDSHDGDGLSLQTYPPTEEER